MYVRRVVAALAAALLGSASAADLQAQAANYPTFEMPRTEQRAFNFAVADGDAMGTSLLVQWREGMSPRMQLGLDAGFGDPDAVGADSYFFLGGSLGYQLARSNAQMPVDIMLSTGINAGFMENNNFFRVPVGVSVGHRFPLERAMAITPFVHPRLLLDHCDDCFAGESTEIGLGFDLGFNFDFTQQMAVRFSASMANGELFEDQDAFGFGFVWRPATVVRR